MAEKLKRLMEDESLPAPAPAKRPDYSLNKVVGAAVTTHRPPAPQAGGGGGGGVAPPASGHLVEDPSLYQHPEDPGAFNLQYRYGLVVPFTRDD